VAKARGNVAGGLRRLLEPDAVADEERQGGMTFPAEQTEPVGGAASGVALPSAAGLRHGHPIPIELDPLVRPRARAGAARRSPTLGRRQTRHAALRRRGGGERIEGEGECHKEGGEFGMGFLKILLKGEGFFCQKT
jgi:hypothetical protein